MELLLTNAQWGKPCSHDIFHLRYDFTAIQKVMFAYHAAAHFPTASDKQLLLALQIQALVSAASIRIEICCGYFQRIQLVRFCIEALHQCWCSFSSCTLKPSTLDTTEAAGQSSGDSGWGPQVGGLQYAFATRQGDAGQTRQAGLA